MSVPPISNMFIAKPEKVLPLKYDGRFYAHKTYLLSGCLGGIGRSISKWMVKQGARKFVFIGRSGLDKEPAARLVKDLEDSGASVKVVRGDVGNYEDVQKCADAADGLIGGVVQAAMGLDVSIYSSPCSPRQVSNAPIGSNFYVHVKRVLAYECQTKGPGFMESSQCYQRQRQRA